MAGSVALVEIFLRQAYLAAVGNAHPVARALSATLRLEGSSHQLILVSIVLTRLIWSHNACGHVRERVGIHFRSGLLIVALGSGFGGRTLVNG